MVHDVATKRHVGRDTRTVCFAIKHLPGETRREGHLHVTCRQCEQRSGKRAPQVQILVEAARQIGREKQQIGTEVGSKRVGGAGQYARAQGGEVCIAGGACFICRAGIIAGQGPAPAAKQMVKRAASLENPCFAFSLQRLRAVEIAAERHILTER